MVHVLLILYSKNWIVALHTPLFQVLAFIFLQSKNSLELLTCPSNKLGALSLTEFTERESDLCVAY